MNRTGHINYLLSALLLAVNFSFGQTAESSKLNRAIALKNDRMFNESLVLFRSLLQADSSNIVLLSNTAFLMARQGIHMATPQQRLKVFSKANYLARKAILLKPDDAFSHFTLAFALGRESEEVNVSKKIDYAKEIRLEAETAIRLDSTMAGPYHILGMWHQIAAGFNGVEKAMITTFFGKGLEGGSYELAIVNFKKAAMLEPDNVNHPYQIGMTYLKRNTKGDKEKAVTAFKTVTRMPVSAADDKLIKADAEAQLTVLQKHQRKLPNGNK